jgi:DNA adenine methylase
VVSGHGAAAAIRELHMSQPLTRREVTILSPLRYPGAKRRLSGYIAEVLRLNGLRPKLFVEPFAGGASVSLELLNKGLVEGIALGERDPLVASFWKVVFWDTDWLVEQIQRVAVTLERWHYFRSARHRTNRDRALACLFLNRTSFSGILSPTAGPIGGQSQEGKYPIDCRFPADTLVKRVRQAAALADHVRFVHWGGWAGTVAKVDRLGIDRGQVFYYLDPPFYKKSDRLYAHVFGPEDHQRLHDGVVKLKQHWLLSYDPAPAIVGKYSHNGEGPKRVDLLYSASRGGSVIKAQELIVTSLPRLPEETRLWRSSAEWSAPSACSPAGKNGTRASEPGELCG